MIIHPRYYIVKDASLDLSKFIQELYKKHDLTLVEMVKILTSEIDNCLRSMLRIERHPEDPNKKADEE